MQSITAINQSFIENHAERNQALNVAARRLMERLLGCWQHELSRPFTHRGRTYRVCVKCGMSRDFNLSTWKSQGAFYRTPAETRFLRGVLAETETAPRMRLVS